MVFYLIFAAFFFLRLFNPLFLYIITIKNYNDLSLASREVVRAEKISWIPPPLPFPFSPLAALPLLQLVYTVLKYRFLILTKSLYLMLTTVRVCMALRMSTRFAIQKRVQKIFFRYQYCATRPTYQTRFPGYVRRGRSRSSPLRATLKNGCNHLSGYLRPGGACQWAAARRATSGQPRWRAAPSGCHRFKVPLERSRERGQSCGCISLWFHNSMTWSHGGGRQRSLWSARHQGHVAPLPSPRWAKAYTLSDPSAGFASACAGEPKSRCLTAAGILWGLWMVGFATVPPDSRG